MCPGESLDRAKAKSLFKNLIAACSRAGEGAGGRARDWLRAAGAAMMLIIDQ
jgi:hypothetical protein